MADNNDSNLWCLILSCIIVSFMVGYTAGFFMYNKPVVQPKSTFRPSNATRLVKQAIQQQNPNWQTIPSANTGKASHFGNVGAPNVGPQSERFHNVTSSKAEEEDNDDKVISRMKRS